MYWHLNRLYEYKARELSRSAQNVGAYLANKMTPENSYQISYSRLQGVFGPNREYIANALKELQRAGVIEAEKATPKTDKEGRWQQAATRYYFTLKCPQGCSGEAQCCLVRTGLKDTNTLETEEQAVSSLWLATLRQLIGKLLVSATVSPDYLAVYTTVSETLESDPGSIQARLETLLKGAGDPKSYLESILKRNPQTLLAKEKRANKEKLVREAVRPGELCGECSELTNSQRDDLENGRLPLHQVAPELQAWHQSGELCEAQRTVNQTANLWAALEHYEAKYMSELPEPYDSREAIDQVAQIVTTRETAAEELLDPTGGYWQLKRTTKGTVTIS